MLLVGLGNPGSKYQLNRHNIGFLAVQEILHRYSFADWREKFNGLYSSGDINGQKVHLLLPQTFMNLSGRSVQQAAAFFKVSPQHILVFHDELDLEPGVIRFKTGGGHAGHNGLRSMVQELGTADFRRCRIGIGHPGQKELVTPWVLGDFRTEERPLFADACTKIAALAPHFATDSDATLSSLINNK